MEVLATVIAIIAFTYFLLRFKSFRKFVLCGIACIFILGISIYGYSKWDRSQEKKKSVFPVSEIKLSKINLRRNTYSSTSFRLSGEIKNLSATQELEAVKVRVLLFDCPKKNANDCDTVGDETEVVRISGSVPPGQKRSFEDEFYFYNLPKIRDRQFQVDILGASSSYFGLDGD